MPVNEETRQLGLLFGTAEEGLAKTKLTDGGLDVDLSTSGPIAVPKPRSKEKTAASATIEEVCKQLNSAFTNVARNKGAPGPDRQGIEEVRKHLSEILTKVTTELLAGTYQPGNIRRVWIPKGGGGQRGLGIPNEVDRVVQEAVRQVLEPVYEPTFHEASHGFRPERSCHTAIVRAYEYVDEGNEWVVDIDLERYFDTVNHQRLMARLSERVNDRNLLVLIGRMLKAKVVMPDGVTVGVEEGVPQGGPLSPLLSNLVLDELDQELAERGHRFVRYADDCNIYVRSEKAGHRVMASVTRFIEKRLRLKVNSTKSAVARVEERHFLGFQLRRDPREGEMEVTLSVRSKERIGRKIRELTPRSHGNTLEVCIRTLSGYLRGWMGFFCICTKAVEQTLGKLDAHIRRRLRAIQLKQWKKKRTIAKRLIQLGVSKEVARACVHRGRKSTWVLSRTPAVHQGLRNGYFVRLGLVSLLEEWKRIQGNLVAPAEPRLTLG